MDGTRDPMLRTPPHSLEAEQAVIGGLLIDNRAMVKIADWLAPEDFYRNDHQLIFRGIAWLSERGQPADSITLGEWFEAQGIADAVGGSRYILELASTTPGAANVEAYAEIVLERSKLRRAIDVGTSLTNAAFESRGKTSLDMVSEAQQALAALHLSNRAGGLQPAKPIVQQWHRDLQRRYESKTMPGLPWPWWGLNKRTHGAQPRETILVGGRPNMGKSIFVWQMAMHTALRGHRVAGFSLEMQSASIIRRCAAALESIQHDWLLEPDDDALNWESVTRAIQTLSTDNLWIDDTPRLSARQIIARAKREHLRKRIELIVVDHVHEMTLPGKQGEAIERGDALRELRALGRELGCPVIVAAQLNRGPATDQGRRPSMADLKNSGGLEEVADVAILLHREDYYRPDTHMKGVLEAIIAKGRDIKSGTTEFLANRFEHMRLDDWKGPLPERPGNVSGSAGMDRATQGFDA